MFERFADGRSDELPAWTIGLIQRKTLWREYGIAWTDPTFEELQDALTLEAVLGQRKGKA